MTYGLNRQLFVENGPALTVADGRSPRSSMVHRAWHGLDSERRLAIVERTLKPANDDGIDGFPFAL